MANEYQILQFELPAIQTTTIFQVEEKVVHYVPVAMIYNSDPPVKRLCRSSLEEFAIWFFPMGFLHLDS